MSNTFMNVDDVAAELGVSKSYAYKVVQKLNQELKNMGFLTIAGRINKQYFITFQLKCMRNISGYRRLTCATFLIKNGYNVTHLLYSLNFHLIK